MAHWIHNVTCSRRPAAAPFSRGFLLLQALFSQQRPPISITCARVTLKGLRYGRPQCPLANQNQSSFRVSRCDGRNVKSYRRREMHTSLQQLAAVSWGSLAEMAATVLRPGCFAGSPAADPAFTDSWHLNSCVILCTRGLLSYAACLTCSC